MIVPEKIIILSKLHEKINNYSFCGVSERLNEVIENSINNNRWFTKEFIIKAIQSVNQFLNPEKLNRWKLNYSDINKSNIKKVAVIMAGNIPLVGFHDFLCVYITGNKFIGKLSTQDKYLLPFIAQEIIDIAPKEEKYIEFTESRLSEFDAIIATGSNNSSRYFEHYFGKYPHIIRKSRNSIAVLSGKESDEDIRLLMDDIFLYFGLGCRNVSKVFIPCNYDFSRLIKAMDVYKDILLNHNKYMNNYEYYKSIYLLNQISFIDTGFCMIVENIAVSSPISVMYYQQYTSLNQVISYVNENRENIQCIVSADYNISNDVVAFGKSQEPNLWDYSDGIDTIQFLESI